MEKGATAMTAEKFLPGGREAYAKAQAICRESTKRGQEIWLARVRELDRTRISFERFPASRETAVRPARQNLVVS